MAAEAPTDPANPPLGHVFVSYTHKDVAEAKKVVSLLQGAGIDVWWDGLIEAGDNFSNATEHALESAACVVVLWTRQSIESHWVRDEAQRGREKGCLVPLSMDGEIPPLGFRQFQFLDVSAWRGSASDKHAETILAAVRAQLAGKEAPPGDPSAAANSREPSAGLAVSRRRFAIGTAAVAGLGAASWWGYGTLGGATANSTSLAVVPFENLSRNEEQNWFSNGLSNELRATLAQNPKLRVSAPTSSRLSAEGQIDLFELARKLGVEHLLRGSVQLAGETTRISVELVQVSDGLVRWAQSFDRQLEDIFAVQSEIAQTVALSLIAEITSDEEARRSLTDQAEIGGTTNIVAYEAFLRGKAFFDLSSGQESDRAALAQFEAAIDADPEYAAAHAMKSTMHAAIANSASDETDIKQLYDLSVASAERSIALAPDLAIGHLALGFAYNNGRLNRAQARPHYQRASELAPGNADVIRSVAVFFAYGNERAQARELIDDVLELDPLNARAFRSAGFIALLSREFPVVIQRMNQALELNPKLASAKFAIGNALYFQEDFAGALAAFEEEPVAIFKLTGQAVTYGKLNDTSAAEAALAELLESYQGAGLYQQAQIHAQWGDLAEAIAILERAAEASDPGLLFLPNDPMLDPLRGEAGFEALRSTLNV